MLWNLLVLLFAVALVVIVLGWVEKMWVKYGCPSAAGAHAHQHEAPTPRNGGGGGEAWDNLSNFLEAATSEAGPESWGGVAKVVGQTFVLPWIVSRCRLYNPNLSWSQELQLVQMIRKLIEAWKRGERIKPIVRGVMALAVPDAALACELVESILASGVGQDKATNPIREKEASIDIQDASELDQMLHRTFGCKVSTLARLSPPVKQALLKALQSEPSCPITLDNLINSDTRKLEPDVAMLVQNQPGTTICHVHLYRKSALDNWFQSKPEATNPLNRQPVDPSRQLFSIT